MAVPQCTVVTSISASKANPESVQHILLLAHAWRVMLETLLRACTTLYVVDFHPRSPSQFQTYPYDPSFSRTILNAIRLTYCNLLPVYLVQYGIALFLHGALPRNDSVKVRRSQRLFLFPWQLGVCHICLHCRLIQWKNIHKLHPRGKRHI